MTNIQTAIIPYRIHPVRVYLLEFHWLDINVLKQPRNWSKAYFVLEILFCICTLPLIYKLCRAKTHQPVSSCAVNNPFTHDSGNASLNKVKSGYPYPPSKGLASKMSLLYLGGLLLHRNDFKMLLILSKTCCAGFGRESNNFRNQQTFGTSDFAQNG